jgi:hypothetical protein
MFLATSAIFVADRPERIIRHLAAQSGPYRDVGARGGIDDWAVNTGDSAVYGLFARSVAQNGGINLEWPFISLGRFCGLVNVRTDVAQSKSQDVG